MLTREDILAIAELMDEKLKPINDRLDKVDVRLDKVDARLDKVDARLDKVDARLDKVDARLDKVDARLDKMDDRFDNVDARLDKVEQLATETRVLIETEVDRAIKVLGEGHQGILDSMKSLVTQDQLEEVSVRVFALEEGFKRHSEQIEELQQKIG